MKAGRFLWIGTRGLLLLVCVGLLLVPAHPQQTTVEQAPLPQPPPGDIPNPQDPKYRLAVDVQLVNVITTVRDDAGRYMDDLKPDDFHVFENGHEQKVSFFSHDRRVPISVGVLLDASGSMRHKLQQALQTVREFSLALTPDDEMFLISFSGDVSLRQKFTRSPQEIQKALRDVRSGGETAMYDAINLGLREMRSAKHPKKIILLVTDGLDSRSKINADQAEELLKRNDVMVYAIGLDDDDADPAALQRTRYHVYHYMLAKLTSTTGGREFRIFTGRNYALESLAQILLEELHQQYTLSYYTSVEDQTWRAVEVKINRPNLQIRNRTGYYPNSTNIKTP
jgi:Ca-activated chloride channel family protein